MKEETFGDVARGLGSALVETAGAVTGAATVAQMGMGRSPATSDEWRSAGVEMAEGRWVRVIESVLPWTSGQV